MKTLGLLLLSFLMVILPRVAFSTHIKGGYIEIKSVSFSTVTFRVVGLQDPQSSILFGGGAIVFSDGTSLSGPFPATSEKLKNGYQVFAFEVEHTFSGAGEHWISYGEEFRNADIINMANSTGSTFYCKTSFVLDPFFTNTFPTIAPDFALFGFTKHPFHNSITVSDEDGDLITYSFTVPKQTASKDVSGYKFPWDSFFYTNYESGSSTSSKPSFEFTNYLGNLAWDAPGDKHANDFGSEYSLAVEISERRYVGYEWIQLSKVVLDVNLGVYVGNPSDTLLAADFSWSLCDQDPPYQLTIHSDNEATLYLEIPFLVLEDGSPSNQLDGTTVGPETQITFLPNPEFTRTGFYQGHVYLLSGNRSAHYNVLYSTDCAQLDQFATILTSGTNTSNLYPNPTTGIVFVPMVESDSYRILDLAGRKIDENTVGPEGITFRDDVANGIYVIQILNKRGLNVSSERVILDRK